MRSRGSGPALARSNHQAEAPGDDRFGAFGGTQGIDMVAGRKAMLK